MPTGVVPPRICSICHIGDGALVPAAYVVRAPDGCEWLECVDCVKRHRELIGEHYGFAVVGLYEWFRVRGLLRDPTC
jgi:hypothetical protein